MRKKVTKRTVDATSPQDRDVVVWDTDLLGFGFRVKPSGRKSYLVQYRNRAGRSRRLTVRVAAFFLSLCLLVIALPAVAGAQVAEYDFNSLTGSDAYPFTDLNGQDGWTSQGYIGAAPAGFIMGVTDTLGLDGTQALRFQDVGPGYGADASRINDGTFAIPTPDLTELTYTVQADFGVGFWGNRLSVGVDADEDGVIRNPIDPTEIGPGLIVGSNDAVAGVGIVTAAGNRISVPLANADGVGGDWIRLTLVMDLRANGGQGSGDVYYQNLTNGDTAMAPVPGLLDVNLELDPAATDAMNPTLWDGVWIHMEGATNQLDNLRVERQASVLEVPTLGAPGALVLLLVLALLSLAAIARRQMSSSPTGSESL